MLRVRQDVGTRILVNDKRERVLEHFLFWDPSHNLQTNIRLRHGTTGFWLTDAETFCRWMNVTGSFIRLSSIPSAEKSILSGLAIQDRLSRASPDRAVAYFYCDYKTTESQKAINMFSTIDYQLANQKEDAFKLLEEYHDSLHEARQPLDRKPELDDLINGIKDMCSTFDDARIIIYCFDDCGSFIDAALLGVQQLMAGGLGHISPCHFQSRRTYHSKHNRTIRLRTCRNCSGQQGR